MLLSRHLVFYFPWYGFLRIECILLGYQENELSSHSPIHYISYVRIFWRLGRFHFYTHCMLVFCNRDSQGIQGLNMKWNIVSQGPIIMNSLGVTPISVVDRTSLNSPIKEHKGSRTFFLFRCWAGHTKIFNFDPRAHIGPVYLPSIFKSIILTFFKGQNWKFWYRRGEETRDFYLKWYKIFTYPAMPGLYLLCLYM